MLREQREKEITFEIQSYKKRPVYFLLLGLCAGSVAWWVHDSPQRERPLRLANEKLVHSDLLKALADP